MSSNENQRDSNLDLIRSVAFLLVLAVHFLLNTEFYATPSEGGRMLLGEVYRAFCLCCVPLFVVLTGYLQGDKTLSWRYYQGLYRILVTYLLVSLLCIACRIALWGEPLSAAWIFRQILFFQGAPYSWYVEMYVGLFLLIPFLNIMVRGLDTRNKRLALLVTLILLSAAPTVLYGYPMPDRWINLWPVTYYVMGGYLRDFPPRLPVWLLGLLFVAVGVTDGVCWYRINEGWPHIWTPLSDWGGLGVVLTTLLLFCLLRRVRTDKAPAWVRRGLQEVSRLSFAAYLVSWLPDQVIYGFLRQAVPIMVDRFWYIPLTVPAVLVSSLALAWFVEWAVQPIVAWLKGKTGSRPPAVGVGPQS